MSTSGVGPLYDARLSDDLVLGDLLEARHYDYPQAYVDAYAIYPNSPVTELPTTLMDLHISSMSEMPFDPLHWDADGNYIP